MTERRSTPDTPNQRLCPSPLATGHARVPLLAGFCAYAVQCKTICPLRPLTDPLHGKINDAVPQVRRRPITASTLAEAMIGSFDDQRLALWYAYVGQWEPGQLAHYMAQVALEVGHRLAILGTAPETHQEPDA